MNIKDLKSPMSLIKIDITKLISNRVVKSAIDRFILLKQHKHYVQVKD
jgi:hypothetical protein